MIHMILDHLWQSTLCLGAAGALAWLLRENGAAVRYRIWLAASVKFLLPFALLVWVGHVLLPARVSTIASAAPPIALFARQVAAPFAAPFVIPVAATSQPAQAWGIDWPSTFEWAASVWALGVLLVAVRWWLRWHRLRGLVREARPLTLETAAPVRVTTANLEPGLVGIRNPVLLLPARLIDQLAPGELDSIVAHELAHLRRRDNLTFALHMVSEILFWFYPPIWWLGRRLLLERERACDEEVLTAGHDAQVYGEGILKVCRFYLPASPGWSAGAAGSDLRTRMSAILSGTRAARVTATKRALLVTSVAAAVLVPLLFGSVPAPAAAVQDDGSGSTVTPQQILQRRYEQARPRTAIPFHPADFDKFAGYYLVPHVDQILRIYRQDDHFFMQNSLGVAPVEIYAEGPKRFFAKVAPVQISFNLAAGGQVTGLVVHSGGLLTALRKISARQAQEVRAELQERIKQDKPSPGTEAAARKLIETQEAGHPDYEEMVPNLAAMAQLQQTLMQRMFAALGPLQSLQFKKVAPTGLDIYQATFAHGTMKVVIGPLTSDGKVSAFAIVPSAL
jgi:beta-lactamase regulating signal transducer with metallopeptidase domain